ncbi:MAG: 2-oxoglutarate dehydrogenase subunit E1, partial [Chlamydiia bacterium]|nr:2-oxoglutarate dehydrogenase subunit E1 [Chlamydiia bacterium]
MSSERPFTYLHLENVEMVERLYAQFQRDPLSVDETWRYFFEGVAFDRYRKPSVKIDQRIFQLIDAYREKGYLQAHINPVALHERRGVEKIHFTQFGFSESDLGSLFSTSGLPLGEEATLQQIVDFLQETYCSSRGVEYVGVRPQEMEAWLQKHLEVERFSPKFSVEEKKQILEELNKAELFETFLHTKYVGQKRFSLEGGETLIPILKELIEMGVGLGMEEVIIGMSHRGRLNVLANILNKSLSMIFSEFEDYVDPSQIEGSGDVKYHRGFSSTIQTRAGSTVHI